MVITAYKGITYGWKMILGKEDQALPGIVR